MDKLNNIKNTNNNSDQPVNYEEYLKEEIYSNKFNETLEKKKLIKKKLHVDYQQMYEDTIKSGDLEGARIMKKMIRKLSSRIIEEDKNIIKISDSDDIGDTDNLVQIKNYDDFKYIDIIIDNVDVDFLDDQLGNFTQYNILENLDYDISRINNHKTQQIQENKNCENFRFDRKYHEEKFKEIKIKKNIRNEKFKNSKLYGTYRKLYDESICDGNTFDAIVLKKIVHKLFE
jgi:hypothetical protein